MGLEKLLKDNHINIPRVRFIISMLNQELITENDIKEMQNYYVGEVVSDLIYAIPIWVGTMGYEYSNAKNKTEARFLTRDPKQPFIITNIRWDRIRGKRRKRVKFAIKKKFKAIKRYAEVWNKYVGREDVIVVRARIGGNNWAYYDGHKIEKESWFLDKVDTYYDDTYCYIFVHIKGEENE